MATINIREKILNSGGTYDIVHKETDANLVLYDNTASGLVAENEQDAVDEIVTLIKNYNSYASSIDANGIYTVVDYERADATLYLKSTLSGGTSPSYTTDTWQFYDALGTTVVLTKTWTISYDANGKITSKVVA